MTRKTFERGESLRWLILLPAVVDWGYLWIVPNRHICKRAK